MLSDREAAIMVWCGVLVLILVMSAIVSANLRASFLDVLRAARSPKLLFAALVCLVWVVTVTRVLELAGVWTPDLTKETVLFGFGTALPLVFNKELLSGGATVRSRAAAMLAPATILEFVSGLYVFPLGVELVLVPLVVILVVRSETAKSELGKSRVRVMLGILGLVYVIYSVSQFLVNAGPEGWELLVRTIAYIVLIAAAVIPYAILFGIWVTFTDKMHWISFKREPGMLPRWRVTVAIIRVFAGKTALLGRTPPIVIMQMSRASSITDATHRARKYWARQEELADADQARENALLEFAGIHGIDSELRQLDRREFAATCNALSWLWTCMSGQYSKQDRFRANVLEIAGPYERHGLPEPNGLIMRIRNGGQSWFAYRRTVTGWVFGIGGNAPGDQWTYDGVEAPQDFPREGSEWVRFASSLNWEH